MTDSTFQGLTSEQKAFNDPTAFVRDQAVDRDQVDTAQEFRSRFGGPNQDTMPPYIEGLHEISGLTEGRLSSGAYVTVAVSDKNTKDRAHERDGTGMVAISYSEGGVHKYEVIDFRQEDGSTCFDTFTVGNNARQMGGFEDVSYVPGADNGSGTYYFVQEGGKTWDPSLKHGQGDWSTQDPAIFKAKIIDTCNELQQVTGHAMQLVDNDPIVVPAGTLKGAYGGYGNGVEGMAVDKNGNIYVGFQDSGKIFKGTLNGDQYTWDTTAVLDTKSGDLSGMAFDSSGNLVVSFGSHGSNGNSVTVYKNGDKGWEAQPTTGVNKVYGNDMADVEAIMVDHDNKVIAGSDNGEKDNTKFQNLGLVSSSDQGDALRDKSEQNTVLGNEQQSTAMS